MAIVVGMLLFDDVPRFFRMRRMLQSDDPAALPVENLFEVGDGLPLSAGKQKWTKDGIVPEVFGMPTSVPGKSRSTLQSLLRYDHRYM